MKIQSLSYQDRAAAFKIIGTLDRHVKDFEAKSMFDQDDGKGTKKRSSHSEGCGRGFYSELRDTKMELRYDPATRQTQSYHYTHLHEEGYLQERETLHFAPQADGSKIYTRRNFVDGAHLVKDKTETVRLAADGNLEYAIKDSSPSVENWLRQHRGFDQLGSMGLGAGILGGLGYALAGPWVGALAAPIGAAIGLSQAREKQSDYPNAPYASSDHKVLVHLSRVEPALYAGAAVGMIGIACRAIGVI